MAKVEIAKSNKSRVIVALLAAPTISEAAKQAALSEKTVYRYLEDPDFKADYRKARRDVYEAAIGQMQSVTVEAIGTLRSALTCGTASVEVRAAQILLDYSSKSFETLDLMERLERLERIRDGR